MGSNQTADTPCHTQAALWMLTTYWHVLPAGCSMVYALFVCIQHRTLGAACRFRQLAAHLCMH